MMHGTPQTRAVAAWDGQIVRVWDDVDAFKRAVPGDAITLAAALAHEQYHIDHGPAEGPAYAEQLRVLRALGARARDVHDVEKAAALIAR